MHRVFVAWDAAEAKRFQSLLESHGIRARVIEDREYPSRGELHDTEGAPEVWIHDASQVQHALELASGFESKRAPPPEAEDGGD
jgi:hypothetical protein